MVRLDLNLYPLNRGVVPVLPRKGKHVGGGGATRRTRRGVARASPPSTRLPSRSISLVCKGQQLLLWELCIIEEVSSLSPFLPSLSAMRLEIENETNRRRSDKGTLE